MIPKLSKASKMPCKSFSLPVNQEVCRGMNDALGNIKPVCKACYAKKGSYRYPVVKALREHNLLASKQLDNTFVNSMVEQLRKQSYFRWFDSGDIYSNKFLDRIVWICKNTPNTNHWIPTKSRELFDQALWTKLEALKNVTIRYSSPSIMGSYQDKHGSTVVTALHQSTKELFYCPSSKQEGKCKTCRACWNGNIKVIAYLKH